jgi:cytochrome P450
MTDFAKKVIEERQKEFDDSNHENENKSAFLDLLLNTKRQNPNLISLENILEEVETFMFAGHDKVSTTLSWTCQMIGSHPDVQKR